MKELATVGGIGSAIGALLYVTINLFLPSGISIFSLSLTNPEQLITNLPTIILVAVISEFVGLAIGGIIAKFTDLI
ncbi:hypothetical protein HOC32_05620 [Candidatus Woesearchaeota archaeon]|jgi:hypothetical protein|nr:hypothetical protein [Candidatus Woesearchaeota archaeon]